ncbi:hypothetical protein CDO28_24195 (plasmid) [Sinorhizobium meliloti]|nr:hypothetical protein CDO28_24195 [Sinorhizobium meliloti]MQW52638.1 hypothetical protein [Sinorhizobium meliloti]
MKGSDSGGHTAALRPSGLPFGTHELPVRRHLRRGGPVLFILARGAQELGFPLSACFRDYVARIEARPTVRGAERREALSEASSSQL